MTVVLSNMVRLVMMIVMINGKVVLSANTGQYANCGSTPITSTAIGIMIVLECLT